MEFSADQTIGGYRVVRPLGHGGMGAVYEVVHVKLGVHYALKLFTLEHGKVAEFRRRFDAEGRALARLCHRNLVRVIDLDVDEVAGVQYFVMDLILSADGIPRTLADVDPGSVDEEVIRRWFVELCDALAYIHDKGIIHRDIKLSNILLADDGRVVLSDFGISRFSDADLRHEIDISLTRVDCQSKSTMGTVGYMAPELKKGQAASRASDAYALGVVFFKLLTNLWYEPSLATRRAGMSNSRVMDMSMLLAVMDLNWNVVLSSMLDENPERRPLDLNRLPELLDEVANQRHLQVGIKSLMIVLGVVGVCVALLIGFGGIFAPNPRATEFDDAFSVKQILEGLK